MTCRRPRRGRTSLRYCTPKVQACAAWSNGAGSSIASVWKLAPKVTFRSGIGSTEIHGEKASRVS